MPSQGLGPLRRITRWIWGVLGLQICINFWRFSQIFTFWEILTIIIIVIWIKHHHLFLVELQTNQTSTTGLSLINLIFHSIPYFINLSHVLSSEILIWKGTSNSSCQINVVKYKVSITDHILPEGALQSVQQTTPSVLRPSNLMRKNTPQ